jgi:hypothetical protein
LGWHLRALAILIWSHGWLVHSRTRTVSIAIAGWPGHIRWVYWSGVLGIITGSRSRFSCPSLTVEALLDPHTEPWQVRLTHGSQLDLLSNAHMCHQQKRLSGSGRSRHQIRHDLQLVFCALQDPAHLLDGLRVVHAGGQFECQVQFVLEAGFDSLRDWLPGGQ